MFEKTLTVKLMFERALSVQMHEASDQPSEESSSVRAASLLQMSLEGGKHRSSDYSKKGPLC